MMIKTLPKVLRGFCRGLFIFSVIISGVGTVGAKVKTTKAQTKSGHIVTITLGNDSYSGVFQGRQTFQVFIDPQLGDTLKAFKSISLEFLRKPRRGGDWELLHGYDLILTGHRGRVKHLLAQATISSIVRQNSIEFQGDVSAKVAGLWKMVVTLTPKNSRSKEHVTSNCFIVR
ncbi:MAG: hypothetical protein ACE5HO_17635 [bacterium]